MYGADIDVCLNIPLLFCKKIGIDSAGPVCAYSVWLVDVATINFGRFYSDRLE